MHHRTALTVKVSLIVSAAGAAAWLLNSTNPSRLATAMPAISTSQQAPTNDELKVAMYRCGLDPRSLAAAGVSPQSVSTVISDFQGQANQSATALTAADTSFASARQQVDTLERRIQSGKGSSEDVASLATARTSLASAQASQQAAVNLMFNAATAHLSPTAKTILTQLQANKQWELPLEYLTVTRTQADWVALRNALANERIANGEGEQPSAESQTLLNQVREDSTVSSATSNLQANLAAIFAAWSQSLAE